MKRAGESPAPRLIRNPGGQVGPMTVVKARRFETWNGAQPRRGRTTRRK